MTDAQKRNLARKIVDALLEEMLDRRGFRQNWDGIDDDIREEIIAAWVEVVTKELDAAEAGTP